MNHAVCTAALGARLELCSLDVMKKPPAKPTPRPMPQPASSARPRWLLGAFLCLLVAALTWAVFEFVVWNRLPPELVGTWVVVTPVDQQGSTLEFSRSGKMIGHLNIKENLHIVRAMVRVEDDKLYSTTWHEQKGEKTVMQTIRSLTASELVLEDARGERLVLRKVQ